MVGKDSFILQVIAVFAYLKRKPKYLDTWI